MKFIVPAGVLTLLVSTSCTQAPDGPPLVPVEGVVTLDGKPLANAVVTMIPRGETLGQGGTGKTDAAGHFDISIPDGTRRGVVAGAYAVVINKFINPDGTDFAPSDDIDPMSAAFKELLLPIYSNGERTTLSADVPEGGAKLEFKLRSRLR
jgi:hypothetical protein